MKKYIALTLALSSISLSAPVMATDNNTSQSTTQETSKKPHGCLAYGAAGAVGGHFVGKGHSVLGATAGCAYGWHKKHEWKKEQKEEKKQEASQNQNSTSK